MSAIVTSKAPANAARAEPALVPATIIEPFWVRALLIGTALLFMLLFLFIPLVSVFVEALKGGWNVYVQAITDPDAVSAIKLTLLTAAISVPLNLVSGVAASWAIAKFNFRGKSVLMTLID